MSYAYSSNMPDPDPPEALPAAAPAAMELTTAQCFEIERHNRLIDATDDLQTLRNLAKLLLRSWYSQKAATAWVMRQGMRQ
jgi:hypothetical protein